MTYTSAYGLGPGTTPQAIKWLIGLTCTTSIIAALLNPLFLYLFQIQGPNYLLSLSWDGLKSGYLWQPFTYLFVEEGILGLSFGLLITLFFQMYILWIMGSPLVERIGGYRFTVFYIVTGVLTGLLTIMAAPAFGQHPFLFGPGASIVAIWVVWTMMHPESELLVFFVLPVKAKWLLAIGLSALLLVNLSQSSPALFCFYLIAMLIGYFYGVLAWGLEGPFLWMQPVDQSLLSLKEKVRPTSSSFALDDQPKIIDLHTGKPLLEDEAFVDAMLTKISEKGEHSLSWNERRRLRKISENKQKDGSAQ